MYDAPGRGWPVTRFAVIAILLGSVNACSLFSSGPPPYQKEAYRKPLEVPEDLARKEFQSRYPVPVATGSGGDFAKGGEFELPRPPDLTDQILENDYQVERSGNLTWLVANDVPGRVWPALSAFFEEKGIEIAQEDPRSGLQQTGILNHSQRARRWIGLSDQSAEEKNLVLLSRIEHGVKGRSTEVQVRLVPVSDAPGSLVEWRDVPGHPEREATVIEQMATFLRENADTKSYSRVALNLPREEKVTHVTREDDEDELIRLKLAFGLERGWAEVSRALSSLEIPVVDRDRSDGVWQVDIRSKQARRRGWWLWRYQAEPERTGRIALQEAGGDLALSVEAEGDSVDADRPRVILEQLYERLR
mgnify:CR=1 FL=1